MLVSPEIDIDLWHINPTTRNVTCGGAGRNIKIIALRAKSYLAQTYVAEKSKQSSILRGEQRHNEMRALQNRRLENSSEHYREMLCMKAVMKLKITHENDIRRREPYRKICGQNRVNSGVAAVSQA